MTFNIKRSESLSSSYEVEADIPFKLNKPPQNLAKFTKELMVLTYEKVPETQKEEIQDMLTSNAEKICMFPPQNEVTRGAQMSIIESRKRTALPAYLDKDNLKLRQSEVSKKSRDEDLNVAKPLDARKESAKIIELGKDPKRVKSFWEEFSNPALIMMINRFFWKLRASTSSKPLHELKNHQFNLLDDKSNFYEEQKDYSNNRNLRGAKSILFRFVRKFQETCFYRILHGILEITSSELLKVIGKIPVIDPGHFLKLLWDIFLFMLTGIYIFFIPFQMCFEDLDETILNSILIYSFFFLDIILQTNTAYFVKGELIKTRKRILSRYLKKTLFYDMISILPNVLLDYFGYSNKSKFAYGSNDHLVVNLIKHVFLLKIATFSKTYERIRREIIRNDAINQVIDIARVLLFSLYFSHLFACFWYYTSRTQVDCTPFQENLEQSCSSKTWLQDKNLLQENILTKYLYSYYWASTTVMTVGYGDITPKNNREMFISVVAILLGCGFFAYAVNTIGVIIQESSKITAVYARKMEVISKFMHRKNIDMTLQMRVRKYLGYIWQEEQRQNKEEADKIINSLSQNLKKELLIEAHGNFFKKFPLFTDNFNEETINKIILALKEIKYTPGDIIFLEEEYTEFNLYFLYEGEIELFRMKPFTQREDNTQRLCILKAGECFGELEFFTEGKRMYSARSLDFSTVFVLERDSFLSILQENFCDLETFFFMRDTILIENNFSCLMRRCFSCQQTGHLLRDCPSLHFVPDKEKVIKEYDFSHFQDRNTYKRREKRAHNARAISKAMKELFEVDNEEEMEFFEANNMMEAQVPSSTATIRTGLEVQKPANFSRNSILEKTTGEDKSRLLFPINEKNLEKEYLSNLSIDSNNKGDRSPPGFSTESHMKALEGSKRGADQQTDNFTPNKNTSVKKPKSNLLNSADQKFKESQGTEKIKLPATRASLSLPRGSLMFGRGSINIINDDSNRNRASLVVPNVELRKSSKQKMTMGPLGMGRQSIVLPPNFNRGTASKSNLSYISSMTRTTRTDQDEDDEMTEKSVAMEVANKRTAMMHQQSMGGMGGKIFLRAATTRFGVAPTEAGGKTPNEKKNTNEQIGSGYIPAFREDQVNSNNVLLYNLEKNHFQEIDPLIHRDFERVKTYQGYYPNNNVENVLKNMKFGPIEKFRHSNYMFNIMARERLKKKEKLSEKELPVERVPEKKDSNLNNSLRARLLSKANSGLRNSGSKLQVQVNKGSKFSKLSSQREGESLGDLMKTLIRVKKNFGVDKV